MALITSLPPELLNAIFSHLDTIKDAAECRLACKAWNDPAERAMFAFGVIISNDVDKMRTLYTILTDNPRKRYFIKHLELIIRSDHYPYHLIRNLVGMTLNPNLNTISGYVMDPSILHTMLVILQHSAEKMDQIKEFTVVSRNGTPQPLAYLFRQSLKTLGFCGEGSSPFISKLNEFTRLTTLNLQFALTNISFLDRILNNCLHLQELILTIGAWEDSSDDEPSWNQQTIRKHQCVKSLELTISEECSVNLLKYMLHKLANLKSISIDLWVTSYSTDYTMIRIPSLIRNVQQKEISYKHKDDGYIMIGLEVVHAFKKFAAVKKSTAAREGYYFYRVTF